MKTSQSFPLYHADFLLGTALMTCEQVGAYMRLLCHQWEHGSLPEDCKVIAKLAQTSEDVASSIMGKFTGRSRGKIYNRKLEDVRKSLNAYRKSRSDNGKKGGRPKKHMVSGCFQDAKAYEKPPIPSPSPNTPLPPKVDGNGFELSSQPIGASMKHRRATRTAAQEPPDFIAFYEAYPRKEARSSAAKAWNAAKDLPAIGILLACLRRHSDGEQWTKEGGRYIPLAANWINGRRWEDQIAPKFEPAKDTRPFSQRF